jgi:hypothetical protein
MFSKRSTLLGYIAVVATVFMMVVGVVTSLFRSDAQLRSRRSYAAYDFHVSPWLSPFDQEYKDACNDSAKAVQDAVEVALRVAGYPNEDGIQPDRVKAFYENASMVTVVIGNDRLMDDSIRAKEVRVDLIHVDGVWKVEWAGARYRCWRCFYQGWITWPCP